MTKTTKATLVLGALFAASAAFTPGTAEAHCGAHQDTCAGSATSGWAYGMHCVGMELFYDYENFKGWCKRPSSGGADGPCANDCGDGNDTCCEPGVAHADDSSCLINSYSESQGNASVCGSYGGGGGGGGGEDGRDDPFACAGDGEDCSSLPCCPLSAPDALWCFPDQLCHNNQHMGN